MKFLPYAKHSIDEQDKASVLEALNQDVITRGPMTQSFEESLQGYVGAKWAVSFNSATSALHAASFAAKLSEQDRFITSPNTYIATGAMAMQLNVRPYFTDIDLDSGNMNLESLKEHLKLPISRGRFVIVPVHFSGIAVDMRRLERLIKHENSVIIEDAAHAIGSKYPSGEMVGSCAFSDMTVFSFHPAKTITSAEGGMVTTNSDELYNRLKLFRNNGIDRTKQPKGHYQIQELGGNFHMTEMQAALGLSQLKKLHSFVEKRRVLVEAYRRLLKDLPHVKLFSESFDAMSSYHLMVVQIDFEALKKTKVELMEALFKEGIGTEVHYIPLYHHEVYKRQFGDHVELTNTEEYFKKTLSLPLYYDLEESDVEYIVLRLKRLIA